MRTFVVVFAALAAFGLALLNTAAAFAAAGPLDLQQSCRELTCDDPWAAANCPRKCSVLSYASSGSSNSVSYADASGGYTGGGVHYEGDGFLSAATPEQIAAVQAALDELVQQVPEPSLERDRMAAAIFGEHGFLFDQAELLTKVVANSGTNIQAEDVATIQQNYNLIGLSDEAIEYGNWINERLPAYEIQVPVLPSLYVDPYVAVRKAAFTNNGDAYAILNDAANGDAARAFVRELELQQDMSLLPNIIVIPGLDQ